jgi:hypothetical protein
MQQLNNLFQELNNSFYPFGKPFIVSQLAFVIFISGWIIFEIARPAGAAIMLAVSRLFAGTPKPLVFF